MSATELQTLRGCMKKDPKAYLDELMLQLRHFEANLEIFRTRPSRASQELVDSVTLLSHVAPIYYKELRTFPLRLVELLEEHHLVMDTRMRKEFASCVIMMRNRAVLPAVPVNQLFFQMFRCKDKKLRAQLSSHIVSDIKTINTGKVDNRTNKDLQNFLFKMLSDRNGSAAKCSLDVLVKLYKKKIWEDGKSVNVIASACFSPESKVRATAINFFLGVDDAQSAREGEESDSDDDLTTDEVQKAAGNKSKTGQAIAKSHSKRSRKRLLGARRELDRVKKARNKKGTGPPVSFAALQMLNDPQGFSERLLALLRKSTDKFEVKLLMMALVSRVIATHELLVLNFYPFVMKYMQPHQPKVTSILSFAAQAVHALVPPDAVEPLVRTIANHFITDGRQEEVIAIGLNTVREICMRQPLAMEADLLKDLVLYKKSKDKGVVMAARSLLSLFRSLDSEMLEKKDRGRVRDLNKKSEFGKGHFSEGVDGLDLLNRESSSDSDSDGSEKDFPEPKEGRVRFGKVAFAQEGGEGEEESGDEGEESGDEEMGVEGEESEGEEGEEGESEEGEEGEEEEGGEADVSMEGEPLDASLARLDATRPLTSEEFEKIRKEQTKEALNTRLGGKRKAGPDSESLVVQSRVGADDLMGQHKKRRLDKAGRLASILAGREGREDEWKGKHDRKKMAGGLRNDQAAKNKPYLMVRSSFKVKSKLKEGVGDKSTKAWIKGKQQRGKMGGKSG